MILGVGCDIVEIKRIEAAITKHSDKFLKKNFTDAEILNAPKLQKLKTAFFAKRFAGKEAVAKALGSGIGEVVEFKDIEILNEESGKPIVKCSKFTNLKFHISLSDEKKHAMAFVIIENLE